MDKLKPTLFINYERPIGKEIASNIATGFSIADWTSRERRVITSVSTYSEILVPASSSRNVDSSVLDSLSNAFYIEARRKNMSLSAFSHLDPIKFIIASMFPALLLAQVRRDLGIATHFEFGNRFTGGRLSHAAGFDGADALQNYVAYSRRYNKIVARINNLMIPEVDIFKKWMYHRCKVFKDDEGTRYSYYLYNMANIYELNVEQYQGPIGRLQFKGLTRGPSHLLGDDLTTIERLLSAYEGDDDMVTFATEAIKAGMNHLTMEMIPSTADEFALVPFEPIYDLDDIYSILNAKHVMPAIYRSTPIDDYNDIDWDVFEDNNRLRVGHIGTSNYAGLPVYNMTIFGIAPGRIADSQVYGATDLNKTPIFTHAKITSEDGLAFLTRYVTNYSKVGRLLAIGHSYTINESCYAGLVHYGTSGNNNMMPAVSAVSQGDCQHLAVLDSYGDQMLNGVIHTVIYDDATFISVVNASLNGFIMIHNDELTTNVFTSLRQLTANYAKRGRQYYTISRNGKKILPANYVYQHISGATNEGDITTIDVPDYDYVTFVSEDALEDFRHARLWNELGNLRSGKSTPENSRSKEK